MTLIKIKNNDQINYQINSKVSDIINDQIWVELHNVIYDQTHRDIFYEIVERLRNYRCYIILSQIEIFLNDD